MMCPVCIATAVWITAGVTSTGGISAVVVSRLRGKPYEPTTNNQNQQKGE
jgi:hypothetical protein